MLDPALGAAVRLVRSRDPAAEVDGLTGEVGGVIGRHEDDRGGDLARAACPALRNPGDQHGLVLLAPGHTGVRVRMPSGHRDRRALFSERERGCPPYAGKRSGYEYYGTSHDVSLASLIGTNIP